MPDEFPSVIAHVGSADPAFSQLWRLGQDESAGALRPLAPAEALPCASWLLADAPRGLLYAAHELREGMVAVYRPGRAGSPCLQRQGSGAGGAVHLARATGTGAEALLIAHYEAAALTMQALDAQGLLTGEGTHWPSDPAGRWRPGPPQAQNAPPGSRARSGHEAAHLHMVCPSPDGRHVLATDLGLDRIQVWRRTGPLQLQAREGLALTPGAGPRHFLFSPRRADRVHVLCEESSTLATLAFDAEEGRLRLLDEISVLPPGFAGTSYASDLLVAPDGRHLYALNRLFDAVSLLALDDDGLPRLQDHFWTRGSYPRSAALDPAGRFLYVCNERSDHLAVLRVEPGMGLAATGLHVAVPRPVCVHLGRW
ncbi:beta-propeller fold lactonase family protein [Pelomonas sp. APW6]|uniref:Beta-propeller fold lactonase family protein n=1 Tax=Roseateles subflavus TaxID=3053353 RepID=A0ABT7LF33_9BURK|nr:beta-propeller fold lactonase family protein [Pelomonas sp. APW6]MDL5031438.1 beta-propeller fold lactonase family protein [Pelomonas sp. APW6]